MNNAVAQAGSKITTNAAERYWRATLARDARADGTFILVVLSTRIYCRPSCPARRPLRRNVVFFDSGAEAEKQGFRPCLRCKPNEKTGALRLVERAARELASGEEDIFGVATRFSTSYRTGAAGSGRCAAVESLQKFVACWKKYYGRVV